MSFTVVEPDRWSRAEVLDALADALLGPRREHQVDAVKALITSRRSTFGRCLDSVPVDSTLVVAELRATVEANGRLVTEVLPVAGGTVSDDVAECLSAQLSQVRLPRDLAGTSVQLELGIDPPVVASEEE